MFKTVENGEKYENRKKHVNKAFEAMGASLSGDG
jgi:hypothetical protein